MVIDTSAVMAMLLCEPEVDQFSALIKSARNRRLSTGSWIELGAVLTRRADDLRTELVTLMSLLNIDLEPVTVEQARIGHDAYSRFGIGSGHPARLNFGDCFAYALAKSLGEPLLFKGEDFAQTDVTPAR